MDEIHIRCPKCRWEPDGQPYWQCSCGTQWDTFSTGARCPGCGKQWKHTQCVEHAGGCDAWSLHEDWYENLDEVVEEMKKLLEEPVNSEVRSMRYEV